MKRKYSELSKDKFITKILREGSTRVVRVNAQPSKVLVVDDCADTAVDVDDVQLQDDIQLAVVVRAEDAINKLVPTVSRFSLHTHTTGLSTCSTC